MSFAEGTSVPIERSKAEIEGMLIRYGADQFVSGWGEQEARIQFRANGRYVRFVLPIPARDEKRFTQHPRYAHKTRTAAEASKGVGGGVATPLAGAGAHGEGETGGGAERHRGIRR